MKTRILLASALMLLAFGTLKAQDTVTAPRKADTLIIIKPDLSELPELMRELGVTMQQISDSVDWEQFERDMEKWAGEMEKWGRKMEKWGERMERKHGKDHENRYEYNLPEPRNDDSKKDDSKKDESNDKRPEKKNLLLDPHWSGFEAGLNMLFNTPAGAQNMEIRPLRCWYFGFNIADVGIAFDKRHIAGLFTGIGIGWNNFSWNNNVEIEYNPDLKVYELTPIVSDQAIKNTKYGALFVQAPLMFEVRPTRHMYIDAGVTGGLRIAQWNRVKFADRSQHKHYYNGINQFKLDASFRIGGENIGFFANYALLPLFDMPDSEAHPFSLGFSIVF